MGANLRLLGTPVLDRDGELCDLPLDKPASLLYYLARRGDWVSRSELAFLYRPDAPEAVALSNVRVFLHRARKHLWAETLEIEKNRVRYRIETDVDAFLAALEQRAWAQALELIRGPFLAGLTLKNVVGFETWLELERLELDRKWRAAALNHARQLEERHEHAAAGAWLDRVLDADPLDEEALQVYLRVLLAAGERARALEVYEAFRTELIRELDVEPLEATRALVEQLRTGSTPTATPSLREPRALHGLPVQSTRFVGRKRELRQLADVLARSDCRLLTLIGLGGVGKTRLALALAASQLERYRDGVGFVSLAGVGSPGALVPSIAAALGLVFSGPSDPEAQLVDVLRNRRTLLLLDNFEHLVEGSALLERLLEAAPGLVLLVTSRVALELAAERLFDVEGLAYPPVGTTEPLASFDAVKLFIERAERVSTAFVPEGATLTAVADLTRLVEGLPLALELAASWIRSSSVADLLHELDEDLGLLAGRRSDLPERHRNLRRVFDRSWQRLGRQERAALAKLSIFRGDFGLDAAQRIAGVHLALLMSLTNRSLVRPASQGRTSLHELVRQYAAGFLDDATRTDLEAGFGGYYLDLVAARASEFVGPDPKRALRETALEIHHLPRACDFAVARGDHAALARALTPLRTFFHRAERFQEGRQLFERLANALESDRQRASPTSATLHARALLGLASFERVTGSLERARAMLRELAPRLREAGQGSELAYALCLLAQTTFDHAEGDILFAESAALSRENGAEHVHAEALRGRAWLERAKGEYAKASQLLEASLRLREELRDTHGIAEALVDRAALLRETADAESEYPELLERASHLFRLAGSRRGEADVDNLLALHAVDVGDYRRGERLLEACLKVARQTGNRFDEAILLFNLGESFLRQGRVEQAIAHHRQALAMSESMRMLALEVLARVSLAECARHQERRSDARAHFRASLALVEDHSIATGVAMRALCHLARWYAEEDDERAALLAHVVLRSRGAFRYVREQAHRLLAELGTRLAPQTLAELERRAAALRLDALLAAELAHLNDA